MKTRNRISKNVEYITHSYFTSTIKLMQWQWKGDDVLVVFGQCLSLAPATQHTKPDRTNVICFKLLANKNPFSFCQETNYNSTMIGTPLISVKNPSSSPGEKNTFPILKITNNNNSTHDADLCLQQNVKSSSMVMFHPTIIKEMRHTNQHYNDPNKLYLLALLFQSKSVTFK